jgi:hypothetical protein
MLRARGTAQERLLSLCQARGERKPMKLVNQHFAECSFCGCKYPPQWQPIVHKGKKYCSNKCVHFFESNMTNEVRVAANDKHVK